MLERRYTRISITIGPIFMLSEAQKCRGCIFHYHLFCPPLSLSNTHTHSFSFWNWARTAHAHSLILAIQPASHSSRSSNSSRLIAWRTHRQTRRENNKIFYSMIHCIEMSENPVLLDDVRVPVRYRKPVHWNTVRTYIQQHHTLTRTHTNTREHIHVHVMGAILPASIRRGACILLVVGRQHPDSVWLEHELRTDAIFYAERIAYFCVYCYVRRLTCLRSHNTTQHFRIVWQQQRSSNFRWWSQFESAISVDWSIFH